MSPEQIYLQELPRIERIAAFYARRGHLNADETEEFVQIVRVRLFLDDYAIIRKFEGRSAIGTYLSTVIARIFNQCLDEQWGKWRPSAEAKRIGPMAVTLERLLYRDGYTFAEAVKILTIRKDAKVTVAELEAIYARLPVRSPRPRHVSEENGHEVPAVEPDPDDRIEARDRERIAQLAQRIIDEVTASYDAEDRLIMQMRFIHGRTAPEIGQVLGIEPKKIYKRVDKKCEGLHRALLSAGLTRADIDTFLGHADQELRLHLLRNWGKPPRGPSNGSGEQGGGGEGRLP